MYKIKTRRFESDFGENREISDELKNQVWTDISEKQKVFYFCHPNDTKEYSERVLNNEETYFGLISNDILSIENCAIFYIVDVDNPEYTAILESASMFTALVTDNFVYDRNDFTDSIMNFAKEHNKPILPIMVEPGLEEKFNNDFEDLQLLDRSASDPTQISYKDKLKNYLNSVIISDELVNKVKNEFDSYIFLSYRKKDRKHAQKLMKLIHSDRKYHDIAIWYDEFLIPGENLKTSIDAAMAKSDVFALAVTPNILEVYKKGTETVKNFVMGVEYPDAVKLRKRIFPVELVPTDKEELKNKFTGIENCVNADDNEMFSAALESALDGVCKPENDTPEHEYLIGLAYLKGIDVEENSKYALSLITSSAEGEYAPAMKQLADMYKIGIGTDTDNKMSLYWQQKYAKCLKNEYEKSGNEEDGCAYVGYLLEMCGYCEDNYIGDAAQKYEEALRICDDLNGRFYSMQTRKLAAGCCERLSLIYNSVENNYDKACEYINRALDGYESIMLETYYNSADDTDGMRRQAAEEPPDKEIFYGMILSDDMSYHIEFDRIKEELKDVMRIFRNIVKLLIGHREKEAIKNIAVNTVNIALAVYYKCGKKFEDKLTVAECTVSLGDVFFYVFNEFKNAAGYYLAALEKYAENISEDNGISARIDLINILFKTANAYRDMAYSEYRGSGYYDVAENYYLTAVEQAEIVVRSTIAPKTYFVLGQCYANIIDLYVRRVSDIFMPTHIPNVDIQIKKDNMTRINKFLKEAFVYLKKCDEYIGTVIELEPKIQNTDDFWEICLTKAYLFNCAAEYKYTKVEQGLFSDIAEEGKLLESAIGYYHTSLNIFLDLRDKRPGSMAVMNYIWNCTFYLALCYDCVRDTEKASFFIKTAVEYAILSKDKKKIYRSYHISGEFCMSYQKYDEAAECYKKALEYADAAADRQNTKKLLEDKINEASIKSWIGRFC